MEARSYRVGVFALDTLPTDGGADTLQRLLKDNLGKLLGARALEIVAIPPSATSRRHQPVRYAWWKFTRLFGARTPLWDFRPLCRRLRLDAVFFAVPAYVRVDVPFVFALWDLGHRTIVEFPEVDSPSDSWEDREELCRRMLPQASYVVTGNSVGANEARSLYGLMPERVIAIPFPNPDFSRVEATLPSWAPQRPYFIYPAQLWPHKNHLTLIQALSRMGAGGPLCDLVFVGSDKGNRDFLKSAAMALGLADRVHFGGFVTRGELKALYRGAVGLVFASLLGPNNLPPQEAGVLGCPMILSDLPGHREQLRDGALYVDPLDATAWSEAMLRLMNDAAFRAGLVVSAHRVVDEYTIENYAARLGEIFARLNSRRSLLGDWP